MTEDLSPVMVDHLRCEYLKNPLGIEKRNPRLSWQLYSPERGIRQTAYQILVASSPEILAKDRGDVWNSGRVLSCQSVLVPYKGKPPEPATRYYWKVRVWDEQGRITSYSPSAWWEMALPEESWRASWISAPRVFDWNERSVAIRRLAKDAPPFHDDPAPLFQKAFRLGKEVRLARVYISAPGFYKLYLNGAEVGDNVLDPAFTNYRKRILYRIYDVTSLLSGGGNVLGVMLGNGWYNMFTRAVWSFDRAPWRDDPVLRCQLHITFNDGSTQIILSDTSWRCAPGPVTFNGIMQGETWDARKEKTGWDRQGYDDSDWYHVRRVAGPAGKMHVQTMPPEKVVRQLSPVRVWKRGEQKYVVDFGRNLSGFVRLAVKGPRGQKIRIRYGERLDKKGMLDVKDIDLYVREERFQTDEYILKGEGVEVWQPSFTYHGFRYVELDSFPESPGSNSLYACVVHTAFDTAGIFHCSDALLNRIQQNTLWSFVNNFNGYPTDCPNREKNGWLADASLACETGLFNFGSQQAYIKWLRDIMDSQRPDGAIPPVVPTGGWGYQWNIGPAYDNTLIMIPWYLYLYNGDRKILREAYPFMKRYFEYYHRQTKDLALDLGVDPDVCGWCYVRTPTPKVITTTAFFYLEADRLAEIAGILGEKKDAAYFREVAFGIKSAYRKLLTTVPYTQTSLGCVLYMGLVDTAEALPLVDTLCRMFEKDTLNLDFGVMGSKIVPEALTKWGRPDVAYGFINSRKYPGWGNQADRGATTLWESWDGKHLSLNHIMFGDVSAWFYKTLGGIRPDENDPGFHHFFISPYFPSDLEHVTADHQTLYGKISVHWKREGGEVIMTLNIPANTSATVVLSTKQWSVGENTGEMLKRGLITEVETKEGERELRFLSGKYNVKIFGL